MDSRSGSGDIREDCGELSRLRRERHRLLLRVSGGRIIVVAEGGGIEEEEMAMLRFISLHVSFIYVARKRQNPLPSYSLVKGGMMGGVSSSRSSTPPAMGYGGTETRGITTQLWSE